MTNHPIVDIISFEIIGPYRLEIVFNDGKRQRIDFEPVLHGYYYGPLRDLKLFNQVRLDPEIHTLVWPNDADFDPATLYFWSEGEGEELANRQREQNKVVVPELA